MPEVCKRCFGVVEGICSRFALNAGEGARAPAVNRLLGKGLSKSMLSANRKEAIRRSYVHHSFR
jgi:hypothetical protein